MSKPTAAASVQSPPRLAYSVDEAVRTGAFPNRNKAYNAINRGEVLSWKDGRSRVISADSLQEYVRRKARDAARGCA